MPGKSSTGRRNPEADQANWRRKMQQRRLKFDDRAKEVYLDVLARTGRKGLAAEAAGVAPQTVNNHIDNDPDFAESVEIAHETYSNHVVSKIEREALEGHTQPIFDKDGREIGEKRIFETQLRLAMLKRFDTAYKERSEVDVNHGGGVLVAPAEMTPDEWVEAARKMREEQEATERAAASGEESS